MIARAKCVGHRARHAVIVAAAAGVLAGCGRFSFDPRVAALDAETDAETDAGTDAGDTRPRGVPTITATWPASYQTAQTTLSMVPGSSTTTGSSGEPVLWLASGMLWSTGTASQTTLLEAQIVVDGQPQFLAGGINARTNRPMPWFGVVAVPARAGTTTAHLELRTATAATASLTDAVLIGLTLPPEADLQVTEALPPMAITQDAWTDVLAATISPAAAGDYLILVSASASEGPGSSDIAFRVVAPSGAYWPDGPTQEFLNHRGFFAPLLIARTIALTPGAHEFRVQALSGSTATLRDVRVIALRTDVFEAAMTREDLAPVETPCSGTATSTLTTDAPPATRDHLVIQAMKTIGQIDDPMLERGCVARFVLDGVQHSESIIYNSVYGPDTPRAAFALHTTDMPFSLENRSACEGADMPPVVSESVITVLRLPPAG